MNTFPKITVVTPSYNQGRFIEETIQSIHDQRYPNLEFIVIDGGSTDNTVEILRKHQAKFSYWVSEKDRGQAHGINKGFQRATGDIVAWLNSDDLYLPGTLHAVAEAFQSNPETDWLIGDVIYFQSGQPEAGEVAPFDYHRDLLHWVTRDANPHQPGIFWKRKLLADHGPLREDWHYSFDAEFWCRLIAKDNWPLRLERQLARFRLHPNSKTCASEAKFYAENLRLVQAFAEFIPAHQQADLHRQMTYLRFVWAKSQADFEAAEGKPVGALRAILETMRAERSLCWRGSLYAKMLSAPLRGIFNRAFARRALPNPTVS